MPDLKTVYEAKRILNAGYGISVELQYVIELMEKIHDLLLIISKK